MRDGIGKHNFPGSLSMICSNSDTHISHPFSKTHLYILVQNLHFRIVFADDQAHQAVLQAHDGRLQPSPVPAVLA